MPKKCAKKKFLHRKWDLVQYRNRLFFKCLYHQFNQSQLSLYLILHRTSIA